MLCLVGFPDGSAGTESACKAGDLGLIDTLDNRIKKIGAYYFRSPTAAAAKSLQPCPPLRNSIEGSPPGSPIPGILQASTLEWVAISFSNAWKWKVKVKSLSRVWLFATPWTAAYQGSPFPGIFQARVLEWGATAFSAGLQKPT